MSTSWDLGCRTCDVEAGIFDVNHGSDQIAEVIRSAPAFAAMPESLPWIMNEASQAVRLGFFFRQHAGHDVRPRNEYGQWLNECGSYTTCGKCDHQWKCRLVAKHDGDCSPRPAPLPSESK